MEQAWEVAEAMAVAVSVARLSALTADTASWQPLAASAKAWATARATAVAVAVAVASANAHASPWPALAVASIKQSAGPAGLEIQALHGWLLLPVTTECGQILSQLLGAAMKPWARLGEWA